MPVMNGFVATREIRAHEQAAQLAPTQVVALTGLGSAVSQKEALASGVNIYLIKPVSLKEIKKLLVGGEKA
jgi:CheY-like chemotaxis protein